MASYDHVDMVDRLPIAPYDPRVTNEPAHQRRQILAAVETGNALLKRQIELLEKLVENTRSSGYPHRHMIDGDPHTGLHWPVHNTPPRPSCTVDRAGYTTKAA